MAGQIFKLFFLIFLGQIWNPLKKVRDEREQSPKKPDISQRNSESIFW